MIEDDEDALDTPRVPSSKMMIPTPLDGFQPADPIAEEKKKLTRTASKTNLKAADILEQLKKSSRPPKT